MVQEMVLDSTLLQSIFYRATHLVTAFKHAWTNPFVETSCTQSGSDLSFANDASESCGPIMTPAAASLAMSTGCASSSFSSSISFCGCCISSSESGEPQLAHTDVWFKSMGEPQCEQLTICTFWRNCSTCCGVSGWMKSFSRRKSTKPMN